MSGASRASRRILLASALTIRSAPPGEQGGAVGIVFAEGEDAAELQRWTSDDRDVRNDPAIGEAIDFIGQSDVKTVAMTDRIIGCPHEEGVDQQGLICPSCPFWANRDRWTGELVQ